MNLTLYSHYLSSSTERIRIALALKRQAYDYISVREMGWDEYAKQNPLRLVPAIKLGNSFITQSNAILHFLEEEIPSPPLLPGDSMTRAQSRAFAQTITCEMHAVDVMRIRKFLANELSVDQSGLKRWSSHWFSTGFDVLEKNLQARSEAYRFCFSDAPGWADLHLVPHFRKGITRFDLDTDRFPLLYSIYKKCIELPEFIAAEPQSQPDWPGEIIDPGTE